MRRFMAISLIFLSLCCLWTASASAGESSSAVIETAKEDFDSLVKKGGKYFAKGKHVKALAAFEKANSLKPTPNLIYNLARIHEEMGHFQDAMQNYRAFIATPGIKLSARQDAITRLKSLLEVIELTGGNTGVSHSTVGTTSPAVHAGGAGLINLNTAQVSELVQLHGIGPSKAKGIIADREANGPFPSVDALTRVKGIGAKTLEKIREKVTVGGAPAFTPISHPVPEARTVPSVPSAQININVAAASELTGLPGIGPSKAKAIVADRETNGAFSSCNSLSRVRGIGNSSVKKLLHVCSTQ